MHARRARFLLLLAIVSLVALGGARAAAAFSLLPGKKGCIAVPKIKGCGRGLGFPNVQEDPAMTADGLNLYVPGGTEPVFGVLQRSPSSGGLSQQAGTGACITQLGAPSDFANCQQARGIGAVVRDVVASPDGRFVYAASGAADFSTHSFGAIAAFARGVGGQLTQLPGTAGCTADVGTQDCAVGPPFGVLTTQGPISLGIPRDGRNLYAVGASLVALARDSSSGALAPLAGSAACISEDPTPGCQTNAVHLRLNHAVVSPDGAFVYARGILENGEAPVSEPGAVEIFHRDASSGALAPVTGPAGCISAASVPGCTSAPTLGRAINSIAISPDGGNVYLATGATSAQGSPASVHAQLAAAAVIAEFSRNAASGELTPLPGAAACLTRRPGQGCTTVPQLGGVHDLAIAANGLDAYAIDDTDFEGFRRDPATGALSFSGRIRGCVNSFAASCRRRGATRVIDGPFGIAVAPNSLQAYVASSSLADTGVIAAIKRR